MTLYGYARVSTDGQTLDAQRLRVSQRLDLLGHHSRAFGRRFPLRQPRS